MAEITKKLCFDSPQKKLDRVSEWKRARVMGDECEKLR